MKDHQFQSNRRNFLKVTGLTSLSFMIPGLGLSGAPEPIRSDMGHKKFSQVNFVYDGLNFTPEEYLEILMQANQALPIEPDYYGQGGATTELEKAFAKITGKERAVFLPTGTMANELAIKLLAGDKTKIVVPENSHIFRDEADASAEVHQKRLIPAGKDMPYFDVEELDRVITYHQLGEAFRSEVGAVAVESPVRRADNVAVPIEVIRDISAYCKEKGYSLHLDGARLHVASAWTGISIEEYASYFDTVYISQYKYLNAAFGAILCGDTELIGQLPHEQKILGGAIYQSWISTAMSLYHLPTIIEDLKKTRESAEKLLARLNELKGLSITPVELGTNVYNLSLGRDIDHKKLANGLMDDHNIWLRVTDSGKNMKLKVNASLLRRPVEELAQAWELALLAAQD